MTWYRRFFCGEPIKRKEYILKVLFFWCLAIGTLSLVGVLNFTGPIFNIIYATLMVIIIFLMICQLFWLYWRIRDVIHSRNYAALAVLATLLLPLVGLLWFFIPSKASEGQ